MKKKTNKIIIATLACILGASVLGAGIHGEEKMKKQLINKTNKFVVVEIEDGKFTFNDPILEVQMRELGVFIPPSQSDLYNGKEMITLDDPDFQRAFEQFYVPSNLHSSTYAWIDVEAKN